MQKNNLAARTHGMCYEKRLQIDYMRMSCHVLNRFRNNKLSKNRDGANIYSELASNNYMNDSKQTWAGDS